MGSQNSFILACLFLCLEIFEMSRKSERRWNECRALWGRFNVFRSYAQLEAFPNHGHASYKAASLKQPNAGKVWTICVPHLSMRDWTAFNRWTQLEDTPKLHFGTELARQHSHKQTILRASVELIHHSGLNRWAGVTVQIYLRQA